MVNTHGQMQYALCLGRRIPLLAGTANNRNAKALKLVSHLCQSTSWLKPLCWCCCCSVEAARQRGARRGTRSAAEAAPNGEGGLRCRCVKCKIQQRQENPGLGTS